MQQVNNYLFDDWANLVESHFDVEPALRPSIALYDIVWKFKQYMEDDLHSLGKRRDLAEKIKIISEEKIQYYQSSRFGFIKEFFSSLRNFLVIGCFKSSGQLGLEWSQDFLNKTKSALDQSVSQGAEPSDLKNQIEKTEIEQTEREEVLYEEYDESIVNVDFERNELVNIQESCKEEQVTVLEELSILELSEKRVDIINVTSPKEEIKVMKAPESPKEKMLETFYTIWRHANEVERNQIKNMWALMTGPAQVLSWKATHKANQYELELKEEIFGTHPELPMGQLVVKRKMKIAFNEEKIPQTSNYCQVIVFPDQGLCFRVGMGWLSKDCPIERISIEEDLKHDIWCTIEALGKQIVRSADEGLTFWKKTEWHS